MDAAGGGGGGGGGSVALLPALQLLGALLESPAASDAINSVSGGGGGMGDKDEHNQAARAVAKAVPALAAVLAARPGHPEQIEALRCLMLALSTLPARRPRGDLAAEVNRLARRTAKDEAKAAKAKSAGGSRGGGGGGGGGWLADLRGGLASVLRSKSPREMRHAALDLCAAAADLAGPRWLCSDDLGRYTMSRGNSKGKDGEITAPSFFRLVLELTRVETAVLLHDMTRDDAELRAKARAVLSVPLLVYERLVAALAADSQAAEVGYG